MPTTASTIYANLPIKTGITAALFAAPGGVFKDTAKTTAATTAGDLIAAIVDQSGNGRDLLAVDAKKPALVADFGGGQWGVRTAQDLTSDGTFAHLQMASAASAGLQTGGAYTVYLVAVATSATQGYLLNKNHPKASLLANGDTWNSGLSFIPPNLGFAAPVNATHVYVDSFGRGSTYTGDPITQDGDEYAELDGTVTRRRGYSQAGDWSGGAVLDLFGNGGGNNGVNAKAAALIFVDGLHTPAQIAQNRAYLAGVYGLTAPSTIAPAYSSDAGFLFDGDSITFGQGSTLIGSATLGGYAPRLIAALNATNSKNYPSFNLGIPGQDALTISQNMATRSVPLLNALQGVKIYSFFAGTNDFAFNNSTAQQVYERTVACCQAARAAGAKAVVWTMMYRNNAFGNGVDFASFESRRQAYNTLIRNNYTSFADAMVDMGADPDMGAQTSQTATLLPDMVHPSDAGISRMVSTAQPTYAAMVASSTPTPTPEVQKLILSINSGTFGQSSRNISPDNANNIPTGTAAVYCNGNGGNVVCLDATDTLVYFAVNTKTYLPIITRKVLASATIDGTERTTTATDLRAIY